MRRPALLVLPLVLLLVGCGLPVQSGVQSAGEVRAEREEPPPLQVLPAGPQPGASAEDIVRGFLDAQSSPEDDHAVARQFLAPEVTWDDGQGAVIYSRRRFVPDNDRDELTFAMRFETEARISPAGDFVLERAVTTEPFRVAPLPSGELRLTQVPDGLHLQSLDRDLSFTPYDVYFASSTVGPRRARLVPDRVFLPKAVDPATGLVRALLSGPTRSLRNAVQPAVPPATVRPDEVGVTVTDAVVTVDLPAAAQELPMPARQLLSAQLVWTLVPTFVGVRLLAGGRPLPVDGAAEVQTTRHWAALDPAGVASDAPLYYVQDRALRRLGQPLPVSQATTGAIAVDEVAASPTGSSIGLLTRVQDGDDQVRIGPVQGPFGPPVLSAPSLDALSWGPGDQGLWVVAQDGAPQVWLLPPGGAAPLRVLYEQPAGAGPLTALRVSRDGARVALVFGEGDGRRLFAGVVEPAGDGLRIAGVGQIAPSLGGVADVSWQSGTELAVLASSTAVTAVSTVVVWTVTVDGSTAPRVVQRPGLVGDPVGLAAAPGRPLVVSTVQDGRPQLFEDDRTLFLPLPGSGSAPAYPG